MICKYCITQHDETGENREVGFSDYMVFCWMRQACGEQDLESADKVFASFMYVMVMLRTMVMMQTSLGFVATCVHATRDTNDAWNTVFSFRDGNSRMALYHP